MSMMKSVKHTTTIENQYFPCLHLSCGNDEEAEAACAALGVPDETICHACDRLLVPVQWHTFRDYVAQRIPWYDEEGWQRAFLMFLSHHPILRSANEMLERYNVDRTKCFFRRPATDESADVPFRAEILDYASGTMLHIQSGSAVVEIALEKTRNDDYRPKHVEGSFAAFFPFEADLRTLWADHGYAATREAIRNIMATMKESDWMPIAGTMTWQEGDLIVFHLR